MQNKGTTGTPTQSELKTLIAERLNNGKQKMEVVDELVHSGMTHGESMQIVEQIFYELKKNNPGGRVFRRGAPARFIGRPDCGGYWWSDLGRCHHLDRL
jgi:uncharacterized protein YoaH (UPF0181 family)